MRFRTAALAAHLVVLPGCLDNVATTFPPGLEPLGEENLAVAPEGTSDAPFPEAITFERVIEDGGLLVHARAFVHADVAATFAAVRDPRTGSGRKLGTTATFERRKVNNEAWLPAKVTWTASGRLLLLRRLRIRGVSEFSGYKKFTVDTSATFGGPK